MTKTFNSALEQRLTPMGYTRHSGTIFVRNLSCGTLGTIGYLTSDKASLIELFVGVHFEHVETLYDELISPFLAIPIKSTSKYFPTCFRDLYNLKEERSADPDFRLKEGAYLRMSTDAGSRICDEVVIDLQQYGIPFIDFNASLSNVAATMAEGRGGGIGTTAYRLPIIYWILHRNDEAMRYMRHISAQAYPIGPYQKYADALAARVKSGRAPLSKNLH